MITDLWIENFKGIGERQHIPLRPVTLLFGANSAGKSTVLHALLYLREVLRNHNFDPKLPLDGENTVSLGGFHQLIASGASRELLWPETRFCIQVRFRAFEGQVRKFLERLNRVRYRGRGSLGLDPVIDNMSQDNLMESCATLFGYWSQPIDIEFEIGQHDEEGVRPSWIYELLPTYPEPRYSSATDVMRWLKRITVSIAGEPFFDAELSQQNRDREDLIGYINLVHPVWQAGPRCTDDYRIRKAELRSELNSVPREHDFDAKSTIEAEAWILVLGVLESVEFFLLSWDRFDELFPDGDPALRVFDLVSLQKYLEAICDESQQMNLAERVNSLHAMHLVECRVILQRGEQSDVKNRRSFAKEPDKLMGLIFKCQHESPVEIFKVIDLIRELVFSEYSGSVADRDGWGNLVILDGYRSIFPSEDPVFPGNGSANFSQRAADKEDGFQIVPDDTVSRAVKGSLTWLLEDLNDLLYIGPKRSTVPRDLSEKNMSQCQNWGNGLAAWRWLLEAEDSDVAVCNDWLSSKEKGLGTRYSIAVERFRELKEPDWNFPFDISDALDPEHEVELQTLMNEAYNKLRHLYEMTRPFKKLSLNVDATSTRRHPQEVGEGITQVVPVIVGCVKAGLDNCMVAIEQPELHLHPSLAARLGDLFIKTMFDTKGMDWRNSGQCLIETHSEHLILRILRRIRQTTDNELPEHIPPVKPDDVCVLWVDNLGDGTTIQRLRIDERGEFIDRWPKGFFSERAEELY